MSYINMALTSLDKDTTNRLFKMLSLNDNNNIEIIKKNYSSYCKLELIAKQIYNLQNEATTIIETAELNDRLHKIEMNSKKVPGNLYYHYTNFYNKEFLSIIPPDEWENYNKFLGKYLYNYDNLFYIQH